MRLPTNVRPLLAALLFAVVLAPTSGWANSTTNCPTEPDQNVPIASGETYWGANCLLKTTGDVDSFTFTAAAGDTWRIVAGLVSSTTANISLSVYAPGSATAIFSGQTGVGYGGSPSVEDNQAITKPGVYTVAVTETTNGDQQYAVTLERINPPPPDAKALTLSKNVTGQVATPTAQNSYTFYATTTGTYEVAASYTSGLDNVCFDIYAGATLENTACTGVGYGGPASIQADVTPKQNGNYVVLIRTATNDSTTNYNLEVSCFLGSCQPPPPTCSLKDVPSYNASSETLTMNFTVANPATTATWAGWLVSQGKVTSLFSQSLPYTEPAATVTKTQTGVAKSGEVGILSTLSDSTGGIICNSWALVNTGKP